MEERLKNVESGIRLILEEMRDLKREAGEDHKQAAEDRKQAAKDRKQFLEYCRRADDDRGQFHEYCRRSDDDRKEMQRLIKVIAGVGVKIHKTQQEHTRILQENPRLLRGIEKRLGASGNGR
jgi:hypothetical protein